MQRQRAIVLQQNYRLTRRLECQLPMRSSIVLADRDVRVGILPIRVEHPKAKARREKSRERTIDIRLGDKSLLYRLAE